MGKVILNLDNVSYRYADAEADDYVLKDINYSFETGKVYAIKGKVEVERQLFYHFLVD